MLDPREEHRMVFQALTGGLSGCVIWKRNPREWVIRQGWDPREVVREVGAFLRSHGPDALKQKQEYRDSLREPEDDFYDVVFPYGGLKNGLYLEVVLQVPDDETSVAKVVSVHEQQTWPRGRKGWS